MIEASASEDMDDTLKTNELVIDCEKNVATDMSASENLHIDDECPPRGDVPLEDLDFLNSTAPCSQIRCIDPYKWNCEKASNR